LTLSDLGNLGDFIGGVGVIITLAYLATQIRRNTQEIRAASLDSIVASHMEFQRSVWSDPVLNKLWFDGYTGKTAELPEEDSRRFLFMLISCARHWERAYHRARGGTLDETSWSGIHRELAAVFASAGAKVYWQLIKGIFPLDFVDFAEQAIQEVERAKLEGHT
jgi:hypothetical protein